MAAIKEHLIAAYCFVNGIVKNLGYNWDQISFVDSARLPGVLIAENLVLTSQDVTSDLSKAMLTDESQTTSHFGVLIHPPRPVDLVTRILLSLTISYIWKKDDDIEFYIDNIKEPYTVHSSGIVKYIENMDLKFDNPDQLVFDLDETNNLSNNYTDYYEMLAAKIDKNEITPSPITLNGDKIGRLRYLSDSR